jgi:hypothetical protein
MINRRRIIDTKVRTDGGEHAFQALMGEYLVRVRFEKSLSCFFGNIACELATNSGKTSREFAIPYVRPSFRIRLPGFLRHLNSNRDFELFDRSSFRGNWHVDISLPDSEDGARTVTLLFNLKPRFAGTPEERRWGGQLIEPVRLMFYSKRSMRSLFF